MENHVTNKEILDTKEISSDALDNTINISNVVTDISKDFQTNVEPNTIDTKSSNDSYTDNASSKENHKKSFSIKKYLPLICILAGILIFICIFSTAFALVNINNSKIIKGVHINGVNLSGLSSDEATQKLSDAFSKKLNSTLTLICEEYKSEFIPSQDIEANYNISDAVKKAYLIGRSGNLIQNNYEIFLSLLTSKNININLQYNMEKFDSYIDNISIQIPGLVKHPSYYIENEDLIIVRGNSGVELLKDKTKDLIVSNLETLSTSNSIDLVTQNIEPNSINIEKIHKEIYSEPENAYIIKEPFELNVGSSGVDFAVTMEEAKNLLNEEKDEYVIPLKITPPEVSIEDLGNDIFIHNLGTYTSYYKVSNVNRSTNVELASKKINNVILLPGETFSYNKVVGERTFENGFKEASVYTSAGVIDGLGGGICQVSSTLYNSILLANLEIVERRNHRYAVSYVPLGRDATVAYGSIDFRFKNNRSYPIKIVSYAKNGVVKISIMGIKEDTEYDVSITTKKLETIPYTTKYIDDNTMLVGTEKQTQYGDNGYKYETYKTIKLNGNIISSEKISSDNYTPLTRIVRRGTKQVEVIAPPVEAQPETGSETPSTETPVTPPVTNNENSSTENNSDNSNSVNENTTTPDSTQSITPPPTQTTE